MRDQLYHVFLLVTFAWLGSAVAGPLEKPEKGDKDGGKQTIQEFFTSDWGACEPLKNPLVIPEVRSNGNMNLSKYLQYLSLLGLDNETMDSTREAHKGCISKADKLYVECIFKHFTKVTSSASHN
ncbi:hypothetical protein MTO96_024926 [Rhipicephalus appendiculatus]